MKKTLIAAGIAAVVAAPAFADVKISGAVEQAFTNVDSSTAASDDWDGSSDNSVTFKASEDLGNGLTAFATLSLDFDSSNSTTNASAPGKTKDQVVGLKGAFGTVVVGRMEDFTEGKLMAKATTYGAGGVGGSAVEDGKTGLNAGRYDDAIAYVSPTMNGLHFGVAGFVLEDDTLGSGNNDDADSFDATDVAVFYDNGPLSIAASQERIKYDAGTEKNTVIAVSYSMGDLKGTVMSVNNDDDGGAAADDSDDMIYRVDYTMGSNTFTFVYNDDEDYASSTLSKNDIWTAELVHKFSKQTAAYINFVDGDAAINDSMTVGLQHKF